MTGGPPKPTQQTADTDTGYALSEAPATPPRKDMTKLERTARWCPACGFDLTMTNEPPCPRCERPFIPSDASTTSPEPVEPAHHRYWQDKERVAGYIVLPLFLVGRVIINVSGDKILEMLGSGMAGTVFTALMLLLLIPWLIATVFLLLIATTDYYNPKTVYCLLFGAVAGILIVIGLAPVMLLVGVVAGLFAGFVRAWVEKV